MVFASISAVRIAAALDHHQIEHGKIGAVRFHEGDVRFARGGLDDDGLEFGFGFRGLELLVANLPCAIPRPSSICGRLFSSNFGLSRSSRMLKEG